MTDSPSVPQEVSIRPDGEELPSSKGALTTRMHNPDSAFPTSCVSASQRATMRT